MSHTFHHVRNPQELPDRDGHVHGNHSGGSHRTAINHAREKVAERRRRRRVEAQRQWPRFQWDA